MKRVNALKVIVVIIAGSNLMNWTPALFQDVKILLVTQARMVSSIIRA